MGSTPMLLVEKNLEKKFLTFDLNCDIMSMFKKKERLTIKKKGINMKASRMIELLQKCIENHGDLDVVQCDRENETDGEILKVTVRKSDENGVMPYDGVDVEDSVVVSPNTEYVVLFNN